MTHTADAIVIGAGIHGCSTALHLALRGVKALVIEKDYAGRHEGGALCDPHLGPDSHRLEISDNSLAQAEVRGQLMQFAGVEAVRVARFGKKLLRLRRIVRVRINR